jgi:hypothetical protein
VKDAVDCEALIRALGIFWKMLSGDYLPLEVLNYQNAVLAYQIRTQKTACVRMIHQHKQTGELLADMVFYLDYRYPSACNAEEERKKAGAFFEKCKDLKYDIGDVVPSHVYEDNAITINHDVKSRIEALSKDDDVIFLEVNKGGTKH